MTGYFLNLIYSRLLYQKTEACNSRCEEILFCFVLGAVYIFSFFNVKEERTRWKYLAYYTFCFFENTFLIGFWVAMANNDLAQGETHWYYIPGVVGHYLMFFAGIFFMCLYYGCCHPTGIKFSLKVRDSSPSEPRDQPPPPAEFINLREIQDRGEATGVRTPSVHSDSYITADEMDGKKSKIRRESDSVDAGEEDAATAPASNSKTRTLKNMWKK